MIIDLEDFSQALKCHGVKGNRCFSFHFVNSSGTKIPFQTTSKASGDCDETARRFARLCYAKFQDGFTKEQVKDQALGNIQHLQHIYIYTYKYVDEQIQNIQNMQ